MPVTAWIIKRRITAAQHLLAESNAKVATVAESVGFKDLCYFTRQFVRQVGVTPRHFRTTMKTVSTGSVETGMHTFRLDGRLPLAVDEHARLPVRYTDGGSAGGGTGRRGWTILRKIRVLASE